MTGPPAAVEALLALWLLALGGAVGSFLNVVVYRLPRGMSLLVPASHCPACKHPIRWRDNLPVLGWILLRGRCRDCRSPISPRYPAVEAITAALFLIVGAGEGFSFGANVPPRPIPAAEGRLIVPLSLTEVSGLVGYHLLLLGTLLAAALLELDEHPLPARLFLPALSAGWLAPVVWPYLHPVPAFSGLPEALAGLVDGTAGLTLGLTLGWVARRGTAPRSPRIWIPGLSCAGLFLGWQAIAVLGPLVWVLDLLARALRPALPALRRANPGWFLWLGSLAWILAWAALARWLPPLAGQP